MKDKTVQKLLKACDDMAQQVGLKSYDEILGTVQQQGVPLARLFVAFFEKAKTRAELVSWLSQIEEPESKVVDYIIDFMHLFPMILGNAVRDAAKSDQLPTQPKGRRPIVAATRYKICQFVLELHGKKRVSEAIAKRRAAQHFGVGVRTVDRIWDDREQIFEQAEAGQAVRESAERIGQLLRAVKPTEPPKSVG